MNPDDQEWSLLVTKHRLNKLLFDMDISIWIKDELKENYDSLFKQCFAAMYYNYALAHALYLQKRYQQALGVAQSALMMAAGRFPSVCVSESGWFHDGDQPA